MSWLTPGLTGVVVAAGCVLVAAPARAHCGDDCNAPLPYTAAHTSDVVAADGVLGFHFEYGRGGTARDFLSVTVRDAEGAEVAGTLTANDAFSLLIWRPDAPWVAGATYTVTTLLDTDGWAGMLYGAPAGSCVTQALEREITIDAAMLPAPEAALLAVSTEYERRPREDVDSVVCCDGAMPYMQSGPGSCPAQELVRGYGYCSTRFDRGRLQVVHDIDREALPPAVAGNFAVRVLDAEGEVLLEPRPWLSTAQCLRFESLDLARGEVFVEERCLGGDVELGDLEVDPSDQLGEACEGQAYVCESDHERWDPEACKTWPDGEDYEYIEPVQDPAPAGEVRNSVGYGCNFTRPGPAPLIVLVLGLVARRRRRLAR